MKGRKNTLEWTVFGLSAILVIAVFGVLAQESIRWKDTPADLHVELRYLGFDDGPRPRVLDSPRGRGVVPLEAERTRHVHDRRSVGQSSAMTPFTLEPV